MCGRKHLSLLLFSYIKNDATIKVDTEGLKNSLIMI